MIMALRRSSMALRRGTVEWLKNSDESRVVTFVRRAGNEEVLVAINFSNQPFVGSVKVTDPSRFGAGLPALSIDSWGYKIFEAHWPTAAKNGFGTSTTLTSKVWFTLANGVMTEVFYPTVDLPNVRTLQFQVATGTKIENEIDDTVHRLELPNPASLTFRQINRAKSGAYTITKTYITDPQRSTVLIDVNFYTRTGAKLYVSYDPVDEGKSSALVSSCGFANEATRRALKKNRCTLALGFGKTASEASATAQASLARGFEAARVEYEAGWRSYVLQLPRIAKHQRQFNMSAMVLKGLEDKTYRGAVIASPSTPWGGSPSGYHAVWARDLYHVATAFDALGDRAAANRVLDYPSPRLWSPMQGSKAGEAPSF